MILERKNTLYFSYLGFAKEDLRLKQISLKMMTNRI